MDPIQQFKQEIGKAVTLFHEFSSTKPVRVISHLDADGISACSILIHVLNNESKKYSLSIVPQLSQEKLEELAKEDYEQYIFTDLGSGHLSQIEKLFPNRKVIILDHHEPENHQFQNSNHIVINPHSFQIDGSKTISGSGVVFFFAKAINEKYDSLAHIAIIGAIGDMQEDKGFKGLNNEILNIAINQKKIEIIRGLKFFGQQTRPVHKVLEYSDPEIPGVSNSESKAIQFLIDIGIDPKKGKDWKLFSDLTHDEMQKLTAAIIMKRVHEESPEDILGNIYHLTNEQHNSPFKDIREFSTLLNSCGRMDKASLGIGVCLGDEKIRKKALDNQNLYKKEIVKAINWYENNKKSEKVINGKNYLLLNAEDNVLYTVAGTLASILSKGTSLPDNLHVLSMARNPKTKMTKISMRYSGKAPKDLDLYGIISKIIEKLGQGEAGGHANAAGAVIPTEAEKDFITIAKQVMEA